MFFYASPMQAIWPSILSRNVGHPPENTPWKVFYLNLNGCNGCLKRIYFWDGICWCTLMTERSEHFVFTIRFFFCAGQNTLFVQHFVMFLFYFNTDWKNYNDQTYSYLRDFFLSLINQRGEKNCIQAWNIKINFFFSLCNNFFFSLIYQKKNFLKIWTIPIQSW